MRIGILTTGQIEEDNRLKDTAEKRGHSAELLELRKFSISACHDDPKIYYEGRQIVKDYDIIIPRINVSHTSYGMSVLCQFQAIGVYTTDTAYSIELGRDKFRCLQYLMNKGVPFPTTGIANSKNDMDRIIKTVGGPPLVVKLIEGTEGTGVFLCEDDKSARNILRSFAQFDAPLLVQEFIAESAGTDLRCFVVGDKVVASMRRESQDGDFRANVALGAHSFNEKITDEENALALNAARAIGINIAGVDIIRSNKGPLVLEINVSPDFGGVQGLESVTGVDVAGHIIDYALRQKPLYDTGETGSRWAITNG